MPAPAQLVGDEPVAELGVVVVDVDRGVDQVRVVPVALRDRVGLPLVERLLGEAEHPAGHRDRDARRRPGRGPAGTSFWERVAGEVGSGAAQDLVLLLELLGALAQLRSSARHRRPRRARWPAGSRRPGRRTSASEPGRTRRSRSSGDLRQRLITLTGDRDHVAAELLRIRAVGTMPILPARTNPHRQGVN